eukprot:4097562-Prymnesium_polylepis.1
MGRRELVWVQRHDRARGSARCSGASACCAGHSLAATAATGISVVQGPSCGALCAALGGARRSDEHR